MFVIFLLGDIVMNANVAGDAEEPTCRICRYAGGKCSIGMRKIPNRQDPQCRLHGVTSQANVPIARDRGEPSQHPGGRGGRTSAVSTCPLSEMTGFEPRRGGGRR